MQRFWVGAAAWLLCFVVGGAGQADARGNRRGPGHPPPAHGNGPKPKADGGKKSGSNTAGSKTQGQRSNTAGSNKGGKTGKAMGRKERTQILADMVRARGRTLNAGQRTALNSLLAGYFLSDSEVRTLSDLADRGEGLTAEEREAITQGLAENTAQKQGQTLAADTGSGGRGPRQSVRYLRIRNDSGEGLTVRLVGRVLTGDGDWSWYPAEPGSPRKALVYQLDPGKETYLKYEGSLLGASRVRLWAVSETGNVWAEFKDRDLWLVPEVTPEREHAYLAPKVETVSLRILPPDDSGEFRQTLARR